MVEVRLGGWFAGREGEAWIVVQCQVYVGEGEAKGYVRLPAPPYVIDRS